MSQGGGLGAVAVAAAAAIVVYAIYEAQKGAPAPGTATVPNDPKQIQSLLTQAAAAKNPAVKRQLLALAQAMVSGNRAATSAQAKGSPLSQSVQQAVKQVGTGGEILLGAKAVQASGVDIGQVLASAGKGIGKVFGLAAKGGIGSVTATIAEDVAKAGVIP